MKQPQRAGHGWALARLRCTWRLGAHTCSASSVSCRFSHPASTAMAKDSRKGERKKKEIEATTLAVLSHLEPEINILMISVSSNKITALSTSDDYAFTLFSLCYLWFLQWKHSRPSYVYHRVESINVFFARVCF